MISLRPRKDFLSNTEIYECPAGKHGLDIVMAHVAFETCHHCSGNELLSEREMTQNEEAENKEVERKWLLR